MSKSRRKQQINHWGSVPGCLTSLPANIPTCAMGRAAPLPSWGMQGIVAAQGFNYPAYGELRGAQSHHGEQGAVTTAGAIACCCLSRVSPTLPAFCSLSEWLCVNSYSTRGNAVGSGAGIWEDHLMFLSMWHLFRLQLGKVISVLLWPRECGDWQGKVDYLGFLPPC